MRFNVKKQHTPLAFLFASLLFAPGKLMADPITIDATAFSIEGNQLTPLVFNNQLHYLVTSETRGLILTGKNQNIISTLPGHFSQSDILQHNGTLTVAALNNDTYGVELYRYNTGTKEFEKQQSLQADLADIEALCLSVSGENLTLTTADATGQMKQHWLTDDHFTEVRTVNTGPGIKSCQADVQNGYVYLADENTGLWQYDHHAEAGDGRSLILTQQRGVTSEGVEGVGQAAGLTVFVSPDAPVVNVFRNDNISEFKINGEHKWEAVRAAPFNNNTVIGLYDDNSESLFTAVLPVSAPQTATRRTQSADGHLTAFAQTDPVARFGDAADDPAIWYNDKTPESSVIIGTDKKSGMDLYDLSGNRLQHLNAGRLNNVDVRSRWQVAGHELAIAAASNRTTRTVDIFLLDPATRNAIPAGKLPSQLNDLYGLCLYQHTNGVDVLVNDTDGSYERHRLSFEDNKVTGKIIDRFTVPSQPEGCVADDENAMLYYGEEDAGVWKRSLDISNPEPALIAKAEGAVKDDIEGMGLFDVDGERYLIVSSQGNHRYAVYATANNHLLGTFDIVPDLKKGIDGVSETDGLETMSLPFGENLPDGLLVVQDGHNVMPSQQQNFKLVSGSLLAEFIRKYRRK